MSTQKNAQRNRKANLEALVADLNCDETFVCQKARHALVAIGTSAVPILIEALHSDKQWVRWEAAKALGQIANITAIQALVNALEDPMYDVRWLAAEGLVTIGHASLEPLLKKLIERADSPWLRERAHHILHDIKRGELDSILRPVMRELENTALSNDPSVGLPVVAKRALDALRARKR